MAQKQMFCSLLKHAHGKINLAPHARSMSLSLNVATQRQLFFLDGKSPQSSFRNSYSSSSSSSGSCWYSSSHGDVGGRSNTYATSSSSSSWKTNNPLLNGNRVHCRCCATNNNSSRSANQFSSVRSFFSSGVNHNQKTEGDQQFLEFISSEINAENEEKVKVPTKVDEFAVATEGPKVTLTKTYGNERIIVSFNVNDSVVSLDSDDSMPENEATPAEMVSQPDFDVTLEKTGSPNKLQLKCRMVEPEMVSELSEDESDVFEITEMAMTDGEWNDNTYYVNAELLDPTMYDMLMGMLERRGIDHGSFIEKMTELGTSYEHQQYIDLLRSFQKYMQK